MNEPLISVIVPVFRVEQYLNTCIESILSQTYQNIEILLIDDGSDDECPKMIDAWAKTDKRISAYHKENGGLSSARNYGTSKVKGDYITYVDSDDAVSPFYIEHLYQAIIKDQSDMAMSWFIKTDNNKKKINAEKSLIAYRCLSKEETLKDLLYMNKTDTCATGKLYSKKLFPLLHYPEGMLYEDIPVTYEVIQNCERIARIENEDYYYLQRSDSIQNSAFDPKKLNAVKAIKTMCDAIMENYPSYKKVCSCRYFSVLCNIIFQIPDNEENRSLISELWKEIKKCRKTVLSDPQARKKARIAAFLSYFGYHFLSFVYRFTSSF